MAHEFGVRLALIAFATVVCQGILGRGTLESTLQSALGALVVFYGVGLVCGEVARRSVDEQVAARRRAAENNATPQP